MSEQNTRFARELLGALTYLDEISEELQNSFFQFEHGSQYDAILDRALDYLGVPPDDYDHENDTGNSRDWLYGLWFDRAGEGEQAIDYFIHTINNPDPHISKTQLARLALVKDAPNAKEIKDLTGYTKPSAQARWLDEMGYPYLLDKSGHPKVLVDYHMRRLGGVSSVRREPQLDLS